MKTDVVKLVTFQLGLDIFAADVLSVDRVLRYSPPNAVPDVPGWIIGVIEHRDKVIPVVDLRRRVELSDDSITPETRIVVLNTAGGWVGAIVDTVHEVAVIPADSVSPPPPLFRGMAAEFIRGVAKIREQLVVILDVDRVLASADRIAFEQSASARAGESAVRG
ncbi:MAG TPA: chemotaxis protein CheW [Gemmatimonadaceae bacterium]